VFRRSFATVSQRSARVYHSPSTLSRALFSPGTEPDRTDGKVVRETPSVRLSVSRDPARKPVFQTRPFDEKTFPGASPNEFPTDSFENYVTVVRQTSRKNNCCWCPFSRVLPSGSRSPRVLLLDGRTSIPPRPPENNARNTLFDDTSLCRSIWIMYNSVSHGHRTTADGRCYSHDPSSSFSHAPRDVAASNNHAVSRTA
jgi:hypothetical protein